MLNLYGKIICRALRDLSIPEQRLKAQKYLQSQACSQHWKLSGCPMELRDIASELVVASEVRRLVMAHYLLRRMEKMPLVQVPDDD